MMSVSAKSRPRATLAEFLAIPDETRFHEIIDGELVRKAMPSPPHARSQVNVVGRIHQPFGRRPSGPPSAPGGWWFLTEAEILFGGEPLRPDVAGWRRERLPRIPDETPMSVIPDWVCEILSATHSTNDTVKKKRIYHPSGVQHYWIIDPREETLCVYRHTKEGYLEVLAAERGEQVRAEPFGAIELPVAALFGDEDEGETGGG